VDGVQAPWRATRSARGRMNIEVATRAVSETKLATGFLTKEQQ